MNRSAFSRSFLSLFGTLLLFGYLSASDKGPAGKSAQDSIKTYTLPEIVVSATRSERNSLQVGRSVSVIPGNRLHGALFQSIGEALARYEGIFVVGGGQNPGAVQSIFTRGSNSNHTTIMIDDVRITDPSGVNNAAELSELSFANLDRIEIVRGSHGTLYGSSAIGGVINIMTRKKLDPGFHGDAEINTGTFGMGTSTFAQNLFLNYTTLSGLYLNASANNKTTRGLDATVDTVSTPGTFQNRDRDGLSKRDLLGKVGFQNNVWDVYISVASTDQQVDIDDGAYRDDDNYTVDFQRNLLTYGAAYRMSDRLRLKYIGGYSAMKRYTVDDSSVVDASGATDQTFADVTYKGSSLNNELLVNGEWEGAQWTLGGGLYRETMGSKSYFYSRSSFGVFEAATDLDSLGLHSTTGSLFAHVDLDGKVFAEGASRLSIGLGARWNNHSSYGSHATMEVSPSYRISDRSLIYASYSTGFNAPSLYQLFVPNVDFVSGITRGNRNLQPETSASYEVGLKYRFFDEAGFTLSYFSTDVENVIEYAYLWDKNVGIDTLGNDWMRNDFRGDTYLNLGNLITHGFEASLHIRLSDELLLTGAVSLVGGKLQYDPSTLDLRQTTGHHVQVYNNGAFITKSVESLGLTRRPDTFHASLAYTPVQEFSARLDLKHAGTRMDVYYNSDLGPYGALGTVAVEEYTLLDLAARYNLTPQLSLNLRVENVLDTSYLEINGFTTRGRGLFANVRYSF